MWSVLRQAISFALLVGAMCISLSSCNPSGNNAPDEPIEPLTEATIIYRTDSTEWLVSLFQRSLLYSEALGVSLHAPFRLPTKDEAAILRHCSFEDNSERFVTSDGYTFGMPSASVSKAGAKTKYSVLGLYVRNTVIVIPF